MFFSVFAGIIPLSLRNGGFDTVCPPPLICKWGGGGNCPSAPGSAAYVSKRMNIIVKMFSDYRLFFFSEHCRYP